jgi:hypothetical protein
MLGHLLPYRNMKVRALALIFRVGNKKPAQKNPPNKTQKNPPKKPKKNHLEVGFIGFFLTNMENLTLMPRKFPQNTTRSVFVAKIF